MRLSRILLIGLFFTTGIINAQTDFRSGYIIKSSGDTLIGKIDYRGDGLMSRICKFKKSDTTVIEYLPDELTAFRFIDSKFYISHEIDGKKRFLECLIKGKVNIYYIRDGNKNRYFIGKEGVKLLEIPYEEYNYLNDDNQRVTQVSKKHIGILNYYMQDAPEMQSRIQSIGAPARNNLVKLAKDYHNNICEEEKYTIYKEKQPFFKVSLEGVAGVVNFENVDGINDKNYFQGGAIAHFNLPRINEKIYFKTGFLYSQVEDTDGVRYAHLKVPTHIGYLAPNTYRIRPSVSIGILSPSYSGGIAVRVSDKINLGIQSWVNFSFNKILWIPSELFNYSFLGNIYIEL